MSACSTEADPDTTRPRASSTLRDTVRTPSPVPFTDNDTSRTATAFLPQTFSLKSPLSGNRSVGAFQEPARERETGASTVVALPSSSEIPLGDCAFCAQLTCAQRRT